MPTSKKDHDFVIVITGISGNLGRLLTRKLYRKYSIVGIDARPFRDKPKDVVHYQVDVRSRKAEDIFRKQNIKAVIHLGLIHRPDPELSRYRDWNVRGTIKLLEYCQKINVPKVVLVSTAYVYGANPATSSFLSEDAPLLGSENYPEMRALIEWDMHAQSFFWKHPHIETVILRPVHILGPHVRNAPSNYLRLKRPPIFLGFDPMVQVVHEEDFIQAIVLSLEKGRRGVYNIVGPGEAPLSAMLKELDRTPLRVPHFIAKPLLCKLWNFRLSRFPPGELPHLQFPCMVDGKRANEELKFIPKYGLKETIRSVLKN